MTTPSTSIQCLDVPLDQLLAELRACQPRVELAEQRHQFLDLDSHLIREDYTRPAPITRPRAVDLPRWSVAMLCRRCCDWPAKRKSEAAARWTLFIGLPGHVDDWPEHVWPACRRNFVPTLAERFDALTSLGWEAAPGTDWEWTEAPGATGHGHPVVADLTASVCVVPLMTSEGEVAE
ncbi:DUF6303 family protein [Streptomyces sp. NPDC037389]|uniref:DUF6303 family protein n=1 Tax=Streptomyces sp. NPDC037389 TaxID=3155369 RepID=UPI0033C0D4B9